MVFIFKRSNSRKVADTYIRKYHQGKIESQRSKFLPRLMYGVWSQDRNVMKKTSYSLELHFPSKCGLWLSKAYSTPH